MSDQNEHLALTQAHAIEIALLKQSMEGISKELCNINRNIGWLVKIVGAAFVIAVLNFALRGGLMP